MRTRPTPTSQLPARMERRRPPQAVVHAAVTAESNRRQRLPRRSLRARLRCRRLRALRLRLPPHQRAGRRAGMARPRPLPAAAPAVVMAVCRRLPKRLLRRQHRRHPPRPPRRPQRRSLPAPHRPHRPPRPQLPRRPAQRSLARSIRIPPARPRNARTGLFRTRRRIRAAVRITAAWQIF